MFVPVYEMRANHLDNAFLMSCPQRSAASYFPSDFLRNSEAEKEAQHILSNTGSSSPTEDSWKCCPEGWTPFKESCYYFSDDQMPWDESQQNCSGMGSQLVVINTEAEQVSAGLGEGQSSLETGGQWRWADQTPYNESAAFWRPGEPSDKHDEPCVLIHYQKDVFRNWNDVQCTIHSYRICETAAVTL
uniref:C-type lectin domain-containing protein n=2 Tax=Anas platyrhynchos TaxID=8839 RepID=A0A493U081_ANAPP